MTDMELQAYFRTIYMMFMKLENVMDKGTRIEWPVQSSTQDVRSCAIRTGNQVVVLVVNLSNETSSNVSFGTKAKTAADFFDDVWKYPIKDNKINLKLKPNGTAILRLVFQ